MEREEYLSICERSRACRHWDMS